MLLGLLAAHAGGAMISVGGGGGLGSAGEPYFVCLDEMAFEFRPSLILVCKTIPFEHCKPEEVGGLDGGERLVDHLGLHVGRFVAFCQDKTFLQAVDEGFNGIAWRPQCAPRAFHV